ATSSRGLGGHARRARFRSTVGIGAIVILILLAVVSVSQFLLYESPLAPIAGGGVAIDPLAVSALALAIASIGLLAVAAFSVIGRALERWARRAHNLDSLPLQQLARRSRAALMPILVMAFAVSGLIVGATYSGTWSTSAGQTRAVQIGTTVRVTAGAPLSESVTRPVAGQSATAPVARDDVLLGDSLVTMISMPASRLAKTVAAVPGAVDPTSLAALLRSKASRPQLPVSATGLSLEVTAIPETAIPWSVGVTLVDSAGAENLVQLEPTARSGEFAAPLPSGLAPWTLHAIDLVLPQIAPGTTVEVGLRSTGDGATVVALGDSWVPSGGDGANSGLVGLSGGRAGLRASAAGPGGHVTLRSLSGRATSLPIVISRKVSHDSGLSVGSVASMVVVARGGAIPVKVVGVSPVIPGVDSGIGVMVDLGSVQDAADRAGLLHLSAGEWWVATGSPAAAAAEVRQRAPAGAVIETVASPPADQVLESARAVVWVAGISAALLALLTVTAGLLAELRARRDEIEVLRAVGVPPRLQSRVRVTEWLLLLALGTVAGVIDGVVVCALLVPDLARAAIPTAIEGVRTYLVADLPGGAIAAAAVLVAIAGLLAVVARTIRKQAR
ncbi:MAG: FtsX-like permease family protein, partial [Pseudolysinimonas sp.]